MALSSLDLSDEEFLAAFEHGAIGPGDFPHRAHLRMAWLYVRHLGAEAAVERAAQGIRRLAGRHGHTSLYHDTLTRVWVRLIAAAAPGPGGEFAGFLAANPELIDTRLPLRHYSPEVLFGAAARDHWVAPDRHPLPDPSGGQAPT